MCLAVVVIINVFGAGAFLQFIGCSMMLRAQSSTGAYGEAEFIFSSIKVVTITGLIVLGIILDLGGGPDHDRLGFRYWKHPGPFVQFDGIEGAKGRFLGWIAAMTQAAFAYTGTELVAVRTSATLMAHRYSFLNAIYRSRGQRLEIRGEVYQKRSAASTFESCCSTLVG